MEKIQAKPFLSLHFVGDVASVYIRKDERLFPELMFKLKSVIILDSYTPLPNMLFFVHLIYKIKKQN